MATSNKSSRFKISDIQTEGLSHWLYIIYTHASVIEYIKPRSRRQYKASIFGEAGEYRRWPAARQVVGMSIRLAQGFDVNE